MPKKVKKKFVLPPTTFIIERNKVLNEQLRTFIGAMCVVSQRPRDLSRCVTNMKLYDAYVHWCAETRTPRMSQKMFSIILKERFLQEASRYGRVWYGISLFEDEVVMPRKYE